MTAEQPLRVGVIGCGNISGIYLRNLQAFSNLEVAAVADIDEERARGQAERFGVPQVLTVDEILAAPNVDVILDLTIPGVHADINRRAIEAGKHVYSEKPWATDRDEGREVLRLAAERGVRAGAAPDTFLGNAFQTARRLIDEGAIGRPVGAVAAFLGSGPERWHPNPDFFYQPGAGPLFDMGPYYLTALISLLGPIRRVSASAQITRPERTVGSGPHAGESIPVNTPTHVSAALDFESGAVGTLLASFDVSADTLPFIEIYGTEGTIVLPDPNRFDGPIRLFHGGEWEEIPAQDTVPTNWRGVGLADMAAAIREGRPHRADAATAFHVLDVMQAALDSSREGRYITPETRPPRPEPLPNGPSTFPVRDGEEFFARSARQDPW